MQDAKWGNRKLTSANYPIQTIAASVSPNTLNIDLKQFEQTGVLSRMFVRISGNIIVATVGGGAAGTATGRDNPEALLVQMTLKTTPDLGVNVINNMSARSLLRQTMFERGYLIKAPSVPDVAGTYAVDWEFEVNFRNPLAIKPVEYSLPLALFSQALLQLQFAGKEELFSGGDGNTWDLTGLQMQVWADMERAIAGTFHMQCFDERTFTAITASQSDLQLPQIPAGYYYNTMMLRMERNNVLVNDILNSWTLQGGGRVWMPQGEQNALYLQRNNRETNITDPAVDQTGLYLINGLRDGMQSNAIDSLDSQLDIKIDVTSGATVQFPILVTKRVIPNALELSGVLAAGGSTK